MKKYCLPFLALALAAAIFPGCTKEARYIDSNSNETVVSLDKVDVQDFAIAAEKLLASLYDSPAFKNAKRQPPIIALSQVTNDTSSQFDTAQLTQKIYTSITRSGKAEISLVVGGSKDALTQDAKAANDFSDGKSGGNNMPDFTIIGKILENKARAGSTRQVSYSFQLTLGRTSTGTIAWTDEVIITKQGGKAAVGW
ncbi:MAG: penicillin-binding protein activator LpoB [Puniceicoccales bacterium]|jgi:uncharacterized protein (TIGR02722 family)|nr:penicillin-binding protein activator LpoB [Puniceicoccales bacterium]